MKVYDGINKKELDLANDFFPEDAAEVQIN